MFISKLDNIPFVVCIKNHFVFNRFDSFVYFSFWKLRRFISRFIIESWHSVTCLDQVTMMQCYLITWQTSDLGILLFWDTRFFDPSSWHKMVVLQHESTDNNCNRLNVRLMYSDNDSYYMSHIIWLTFIILRFIVILIISIIIISISITTKTWSNIWPRGVSF